MAKKLRKIRFISSPTKLNMLAEDEDGNVTYYEDVQVTDMKCTFSGPGIVTEEAGTQQWESLNGLGHNDS